MLNAIAMSGVYGTLGAEDGRAPVAVIGVGNALMGDDAFGPCTLRLLESGWSWPAEVELVDVGTAGFDLTAHLLGRERVILLDAVKAAGAPGTLVAWERDALLAARSAPGPRLTPHEPGIRDAIAVAELVGALPDEIVLVGVLPVTTAMGTTLSDPVAAAVRQAALEVVRRVREWGHDVEPIAGAADMEWWRVIGGR